MEVARRAEAVLKENRIPFEIRVSSAHRDPEGTKLLVRKTDADVIIAIAGLSAALPGFIASITDKPVIGVPVGVKLEGLDALLEDFRRRISLFLVLLRKYHGESIAAQPAYPVDLGDVGFYYLADLFNRLFGSQLSVYIPV